ncbi:hypothetical protein HU200_044286 [Digitaria exilis]|uniref:Uncharacterized protein n=1 Tax=Digitaria exilis TaxID=1010633 RepID=A0A835B7P4_9POAL|nr:hypothetical protein HU200_044286 [Digitaria exilis]
MLLRSNAVRAGTARSRAGAQLAIPAIDLARPRDEELEFFRTAAEDKMAFYSEDEDKPNCLFTGANYNTRAQRQASPLERWVARQAQLPSISGRGLVAMEKQLLSSSAWNWNQALPDSCVFTRRPTSARRCTPRPREEPNRLFTGGGYNTRGKRYWRDCLRVTYGLRIIIPLDGGAFVVNLGYPLEIAATNVLVIQEARTSVRVVRRAHPSCLLAPAEEFVSGDRRRQLAARAAPVHVDEAFNI